MGSDAKSSSFYQFNWNVGHSVCVRGLGNERDSFIHFSWCSALYSGFLDGSLSPPPLAKISLCCGKPRSIVVLDKKLLCGKKLILSLLSPENFYVKSYSTDFHFPHHSPLLLFSAYWRCWWDQKSSITSSETSQWILQLCRFGTVTYLPCIFSPPLCKKGWKYCYYTPTSNMKPTLEITPNIT